MKFKFSESEIRAVIQEALGDSQLRQESRVERVTFKQGTSHSQQELESLFNKAKDTIIRYIDDPTKSDRTYKVRMNKKLESLGLTKLSDEKVEQIKKFIKSMSIKVASGGAHRMIELPRNAIAWYDTATPRVVHIWDWAVDGTAFKTTGSDYTEEMISDIFYHELYHALDTALFHAGVGEYNTLLGTQKYRQNQGLQKAADEITKKIRALNKRSAEIGKASGNRAFSSEVLLAKEIATIIDTQAMSSPSAWNKKVKEVFPHLKVTKFYPFLSPLGQMGATKPGREPPVHSLGGIGRVGYTGDLGHVRKLWEDPAHVYVAIQQLRRVFQDKTLAEICNLDSKQLWKKLFYTTAGRSSELLLFFVSLKCTPESTKAFEMIAKSTAGGKLGTETV